MRERAFVAGRWIGAVEPEGAQRIEVRNPSDGAVIGSVPALGLDAARHAIDAAQDAFPAWSRRLPRQRADILMAWHELILRHKDALTALMTLEQGKPLADAASEIDYAASFVRWFAEEANRTYGETIPSHLPDRKLFVQREALGVVALVTPWNFPSAMLTRKAAAALAAGCACVAVPSSETPFSALALAALAEEAGLPAGLLSVLTGDARTLVGALCRDARVRGLSFTGSTEVGRILMAQCAPTVKRLSLELGGHAPFIVFADANLSDAITAAVAAKYQTGGQDCLAANRIFVAREIYEPFVQAFAEQARALKMGDGFNPDIDMGPLINEATVAKSEAHVADALAKGARLLCGGKRAAPGSLFYAPTALADVTPAMRIMQEETF
ncbi:MAG TPA: aldehyde dehydrogenase family protein, partial [Alphaproteobacteria bacterium]|nr:aldehyde dehydrogenase family protein [Alphaproteobacteria bacterium]